MLACLLVGVECGLCLPLRHVSVTDVEVAIGEQVLKIERLGPVVYLLEQLQA